MAIKQVSKVLIIQTKNLYFYVQFLHLSRVVITSFDLLLGVFYVPFVIPQWVLDPECGILKLLMSVFVFAWYWPLSPA